MPTECNLELFDFARVEGRAVVAAFDGGRITSDAGALLLGATDRVIGLTRRLAACFTDGRNPKLIEHDVATLVMQRVVGIALGYEDRPCPSAWCRSANPQLGSELAPAATSGSCAG